MNKVLVVGSVALDSIKTPAGSVDHALGGSAVYSSISASYFAPVNVVGVVGDDFSKAHVALLKKHGVDTVGLEVAKGKTFHWKGEYPEFGDAKTLETHLNVFADFDPKLPKGYETTPFVFLANIHPGLQSRVLDKMKKPKLVVCDTMNLWINITPDELKTLLKRVDIFVLNETESKMLTGIGNIIAAAKAIRAMGPEIVIIKKGAHGATLFSDGFSFSVPAYLLESIKDPTGAGDTFAGAFVGTLAAAKKIDKAALKKAMAHGTIMASFTVQDFSVGRLAHLKKSDIARRFKEYVALTQL
jgi:sugar/nucleoside kinase (ribokinase family)